MWKYLRNHARKFRRYYEYYKMIDGFKSIICIFDDLINREAVRCISINKIKLFIRTNTPDLDVALDGLYYKEYDDIKCLNPSYIIDAGANIGTSAIFFAKKYPDAKIIAIEPESGNFSMLQKNAEPYNNIMTVKAAICGTSENRTIQDRSTGHWGYTVTDTINETVSTGQIIECTTINEIVNKYNIDQISLLKLDIEGGEKEVFECSKEWIDLTEIIVIELHDRIAMGCSRSFYLATESFSNFKMLGEKILCYK
jgi:FkbM family methyltransferase